MPMSMRCKWSLTLIALAAGLLCACAPAKSNRPEQLVFPPLEFQLPQVEQMTLENGIRLYLKQDNELPLVQVSAMIGSGALGTPPDKTGFDDLFAMTWRTGGTQSRSPEALDERIDQLAANLSGSMGPYATQLDLSVRSQDIPEGLEILADVMRRPAFDADRLELARLQAQEQVRRQNDTPGSIVSRLLMAAIYPGHFLGRTPTIASLAAVSRDDLTRFHTTYFAPNNLFLAVSGDFDRDALLAALNEVFGDWQRRTVPEIEIPPVAEHLSGKIILVDKQVPQTTLSVGDLGLTKDHPDQYAARVFNYILGGGSFNSRMMREIRSDRGLAYSAYSYFQVGRRLPGAFVAGTETKNASVVETLDLIRAIMTDLRDNPVSPEELRLAKESQINSFVFGFDDSHAVVAQQMRLDFYGYPEDYLSAYRARIAEVTAEDVQRVARDFLRFDRQQIVLVGDTADYADQLGNMNLPVDKVALEAGE